MADIIQKALKELSLEEQQIKKVLDSGEYVDSSTKKRLESIKKQMPYLERAKVIDFKNEKEEERYIELVKWEQFEKLDKDFPIKE